MPASKSVQAAAPDTAALVAFNTRFREQGEAKDAKEREAKGARRTAGKAALKKILAEHSARVDSRKHKNREEEAATEQQMLDSLQGESWSRVVSMVDVHATPKTEGKAENKGKHGEDQGTARMRDVLIGLKAKPISA